MIHVAEKNNKKSRTTKQQDSTALALPSLGFPSYFQELMAPFEQLMGPLFRGTSSSFFGDLAKQPRTEIQDRGDHFSLTAELPGLEKKDVEVHVTSNAVELRAQKRSEEKNAKGTQSTYTYFHRYLTLPEPVQSGKVDGTMKNGILELKLRKAEPKTKEAVRRVHLN